MQTYQVPPDHQQVTARNSKYTSRATISMLVATLILGLGLHAGAQTEDTVHFAQTQQAISGFGAGMKEYYYTWGAMTQTTMNDLFCNGSGQLGLSLLRISIDPGGENYNDGEYNGVYLNDKPDWDGWGWAGEMGYAKQAEACGALVMATPPAVPYGMTSDSTAWPFGGNLLTTSYADYGTYLESFVNYMASNGAPLTGVSLADEPDQVLTYFGYTTWTAAQFDNWLAGGNGAGITTRIMMPETNGFDPSFADPSLEDPNASKYIGVVDGHCYQGLEPSDSHATSLGIPEWMTECNDTQAWDTTQTWTNAMNTATSIAQWMNAGYNAYFEWLAIDAGPPVPNGPFNGDLGLLNYTNNTIEYKGYAMGQYSKFVRPGYLRVADTFNPQSNVDVTAYEGDGNYVIVAVNSNSSAVNQTFVIEGATISSFTPYVSSSTQGLASQSAVAVSSGSFSYSLPASSIVTFTGTGTTTINLLANPTWTTGDLAGWSVWVGSGSASDVFVQAAQGTGYNGAFHFLKEYDATHTFNLNADQTVIGQTSGASFTFSAYAKSGGSSSGFLQVKDPGGSNLCVTTIPNNSTWQQYTCSGTVPSDGKLMVVLGSANSPAGESVEFDNASLTD